jgi:hypothetical protein
MRNGDDLLGLTLAKRARERFRAVLVIRTALNSDEGDAPFPDSGHRAALRAFSTIAVGPTGAAVQRQSQSHADSLPLILLSTEQFTDMPDAALASQLLERLTIR